jgi:immunoglobulin-binding protein 1
MAEEQRSLRTVFSEAEAQRKRLEAFASNTGAAFQENLAAAVEAYRESSRIADQISLFSPNETLDDISSGDLQFLLIDYHLAELGAKQIGGDRKSHLLEARSHYERFLKQLDNYDILSKDESKLFEEYTENPDDFSTASKTDAAARRATKISRFKHEKDLKGKLEV